MLNYLRINQIFPLNSGSLNSMPHCVNSYRNKTVKEKCEHITFNHNYYHQIDIVNFI